MPKSLFECLKKRKHFDVSTSVKVGELLVYVDASARCGTEYSRVNLTLSFSSPNDAPIEKEDWDKIETKVRQALFTGES